MKTNRFPIFAVLCAVLVPALVIGYPPVFAEGGALTIPTDPMQIVIQGGGFALAVYLVFWVTRTFTTTLEAVKTAIENNTTALLRIEAKVDNQR